MRNKTPLEKMGDLLHRENTQEVLLQQHTGKELAGSQGKSSSQNEENSKLVILRSR